MASISFPFRVDPSTRGVVTNHDGSDAEINEAVALHALTHPGERPMRPEFGTESMSFGDGLDQGSLQLQLYLHGWEHVIITDITTGDPDGGRVESVVTWERTN